MCTLYTWHNADKTIFIVAVILSPTEKYHNIFPMNQFNLHFCFGCANTFFPLFCCCWWMVCLFVDLKICWRYETKNCGLIFYIFICGINLFRFWAFIMLPFFVWLAQYASNSMEFELTYYTNLVWLIRTATYIFMLWKKVFWANQKFALLLLLGGSFFCMFWSIGKKSCWKGSKVYANQ